VTPMPARRDLANAIRALSMDAVQQANSGHPGAPMGMADIAEVLWNDVLRHNPANPKWPNRDRFVLSNGHGSMLIYSLLHLSGYDLPIAELKNFRQLHSKTAAHPQGAPPGPLRPRHRPRRPADPRPAPPLRLRPAPRRAENLPPAAFETRRPPRLRRGSRSRNHHRPPRRGCRQRGGHGHRRE